jgi:serine/threonine protein kinase
MHDLLLALNEMHSVGLVHRDIKPENLILFRDDKSGLTQLKLIDVGLAVRFTSDEGVFELNVGTEFYTSPEALRGWHLPASDLFSAALSIFTLMGCPKCGNTENPISETLYSFFRRLTDDKSGKRGTIHKAIRDMKRMKDDLLSSFDVDETSISDMKCQGSIKKFIQSLSLCSNSDSKIVSPCIEDTTQPEYDTDFESCNVTLPVDNN